MRNYELVIVLDGKVTAAKKKAAVEKLSKMVTALKGKVGKEKDWGVKDLAYKIKKSATGAYLIFPIELDGAAAKNLGGKLRLDEEIIRYLLIAK